MSKARTASELKSVKAERTATGHKLAKSKKHSDGELARMATRSGGGREVQIATAALKKRGYSDMDIAGARMGAGNLGKKKAAASDAYRANKAATKAKK